VVLVGAMYEPKGFAPAPTTGGDNLAAGRAEGQKPRTSSAAAYRRRMCSRVSLPERHPGAVLTEPSWKGTGRVCVGIILVRP